MNLVNSDNTTKIVSVVLSVIFGVLFVTLVADAVSTISTNISTDGTLSVTGASTLTGDVTMSGGSGALTITTSNTATSTLEVGCIQMYATSTATAVRMLFHASSTISSVVGGQTGSGYVIWGYGTCPT